MIVRPGIRANILRLCRKQSTATNTSLESRAKLLQERAKGGLSAVQAQAGPVVNAVSSSLSKLAGRYPKYTGPVIYWSKVVGELAKEVWKREQMRPPSAHQFQTTFSHWYAQGKNLLSQAPKIDYMALLQQTREKTNLQTLAYAGVFGAQVWGFFALGEIIGRRNLIGYSVPNEGHH